MPFAYKFFRQKAFMFRKIQNWRSNLILRPAVVRIALIESTDEENSIAVKFYSPKKLIDKKAPQLIGRC